MKLVRTSSLAVTLAAVSAVGGLLAGCAAPAGAPPPAASAGQSDQAAIDATAKAAAGPCAEPASLPRDPAPGQPLAQVDPVLNDKAKSTMKNGCAGMRFRIAPDGSVKDETLVVESPEGFGFGSASLAALRKTQFDAKLASPNWYYADNVIVQRVIGAGGAIHLDRTLAAWGSHP